MTMVEERRGEERREREKGRQTGIQRYNTQGECTQVRVDGLMQFTDSLEATMQLYLG